MSADQGEEHEAPEPHGKNEPVVAAGQSDGVQVGPGNVQINNVYGGPTRPEAREATDPSGPLSLASGPTSQQTVDGTARTSLRQWSLEHKLTFAGIVLGFIGVIAAAAIPPLLASDGSSGSGPSQSASHSPGPQEGQVGIGTNNGPVIVGTGNININNPTASVSSSSPQEQIVRLTGSWSLQGFHDAIDNRETSIVALYLKSGMKATDLYEGASVILFGFQEVNQNGDPDQSGDPVFLIKTFLAAGFKVDTELQDSYLMHEISDLFPLPFNTNLTPKGYTGGYQNGTFVGSLLFWIAQRSLEWGPTDQDIQAIKYLISQGADCKVTLSFLKYNIGMTITADESGVKELLSIMQSCAK